VKYPFSTSIVKSLSPQLNELGDLGLSLETQENMKNNKK
jgi:hypothetical protein